mgnify:CR=1 FL=1
MVILVGTTIVFVATRLTPTDPVQQTINRISMQGAYLNPETIEEFKETLRELYGLKGSVFQQYFIFWKRLLTGKFGPSFTHFPTPVTKLIRDSLPWTIGLLSISTIIAWVIGSILGGVAEYFSQQRWTKTLEAIIMVVRPMPYYIMGLLVLVIFAYFFPLFPVSGAFSVGERISFSWSFITDVFEHAFLPAFSLVLVGIGVWFIQIKSVASNVITEDYVTYAQTAGLKSRKVIFQYVIKNAMLPQITGLALALGQLLSGALVVEYVFSYPGVGLLLYRAIAEGDYNLAMGITVLSIIAIATGVLIIDLIYPLFDPRVRYK